MTQFYSGNVSYEASYPSGPLEKISGEIMGPLSPPLLRHCVNPLVTEGLIIEKAPMTRHLNFLVAMNQVMRAVHF